MTHFQSASREAAEGIITFSDHLQVMSGIEFDPLNTP